MIVSTDAILWYNVGRFGEAGFAVPNPSNDPTSLNDNILQLVANMGRNLAALLRTEDADLRTPPSINTLVKVQRLYLRVQQLIASRSTPPAEPVFEKQHVSPEPECFLLFPVPYFSLRNQFLRSWSKIVLELISEMMQHTENRRSVSISLDFGGMVGAYMNRIYWNMATELFGKSRDEVRKPGFVLSDADFAAYNPSKFFTQTEMIDTVTPTRFVFTEDQLEQITNGIPANALPASVMPRPGIEFNESDPGSGGSGSSPAASATFAPAGSFPSPPFP